MNAKIREQILAIRDTGLTNMFDLPTVQWIARDMGFFELVTWMEDHAAEYVEFILHGDQKD